MPAGRPKKYDIIGFLRNNPEYLDHNLASIGRAVGCGRGQVESQIATAVAKHVLKNATVLRFVDDGIRTSKRMSTGDLIVAKAARVELQKELNARRAEEIRAYQREYQREYRKDPANREKARLATAKAKNKNKQ